MIFKLRNVRVPYGIEEYEGKQIVNVLMDNKTNVGYNTLMNLVNKIKIFENLKNYESAVMAYELDGLEFVSPLKVDEWGIKNIKKEEIKEEMMDNELFLLRIYMKYGATISGKGRLEESCKFTSVDLRGKNMNIEGEFGSMWVENNTKSYGIIMYVTKFVLI